MTGFILLAALLFLGIVVLLLMVGEGSIELDSGLLLVILLTVIFGTVLMLMVDSSSQESYKQGYKEGQVQAIIGNHHFHREIQPDSSLIWVELTR